MIEVRFTMIITFIKNIIVTKREENVENTFIEL
jgi:hypothetical protein